MTNTKEEQTMDTMKELAESIAALRASAYEVEESLATAADDSPEEDTDALELYEAAQALQRAQPVIAEAARRVATYVGLKRLAEADA